MSHRPLLSLVALVTVFAAGGASCRPMWLQPNAPPAPVVFSGLPTRDQAILAVNSNSSRIQQLQASGATISVGGFPALRASLYYERPRRFRLLADNSLTGPELDLGSNDELFWFWAKRNQPPAVYYSRHDEFRHSMAQNILPIEPHWLIEALGVVQFDPAGQHEGPIPLRPGSFQIRSVLPSASGNLTRVLVIDDVRGWVLEQHLYDPQGQRIASAMASHHSYDPQTMVSLPRRVEIQLPTAQLNFRLDTAGYAVNQPLTAPGEQLWTMPQLTGYTTINLADARWQSPARIPPADNAPTFNGPGYAPAGYSGVRTGALAPNYNGYSNRW